MKGKGIRFAVFMAGAILMSLEIAGGRLLSPDYGGTVFVWGSLISIVLGGLSIGYYIGGKLADKKPSTTALSAIIVAAAMLVGLIPIIYPASVELFAVLPRHLAPLATVASIFLAPSILLGVVSPYAIKLKAKNIEKIGGISGNLYALATIGSVLGTFLTTFVLLMVMPLNVLFAGLAGSLAVVALALTGNRLAFATSAIVVIAAVAFMMPANGLGALEAGNGNGLAGNGLVEDGLAGNLVEPDYVSDSNALEGENLDERLESLYGSIRVHDHGGIRSLYIDGGVMGEAFLEDKMKTVPGWEYIDCFENAALIEPAQDALVLGVGAGLLPTRLAEKHRMQVDAVDINEKVLEVAGQYFGFVPHNKLVTHVDDARMFAKNSGKKYDFVSMDTFRYENGTYIIPGHLTTVEYFEEVKERLRQGGIFAIMIVTGQRNEDPVFFEAEVRTLEDVWENVYSFDCGVEIVLASDEEIILEEISQDLAKRFSAFEPGEGLVYTDNFAPINPFGGGS